MENFVQPIGHFPCNVEEENMYSLLSCACPFLHNGMRRMLGDQISPEILTGVAAFRL